MARATCPTCGGETRGGAYCAMCGTQLIGPPLGRSEPRREQPLLTPLRGPLRTARAYGAFGFDWVRSWSGSGLELRRLRAELRRLQAERAQLLFELGEAAYRADEAAQEAARGALRSLDERIEAHRAEMARVVERFRRRIEFERQSVQRTEVVPQESERAEAPR